jgi:hypothetical protein
MKAVFIGGPMDRQWRPVASPLHATFEAHKVTGSDVRRFNPTPCAETREVVVYHLVYRWKESAVYSTHTLDETMRRLCDAYILKGRQ